MGLGNMCVHWWTIRVFTCGGRVGHMCVHWWTIQVFTCGPSRTYVCALVDHRSVHLWGPSRKYVCALVDHLTVCLWLCGPHVCTYMPTCVHLCSGWRILSTLKYKDEQYGHQSW